MHREILNYIPLNKLTIKNILLLGGGGLVLIWGAIFFLAFSDSSYHLFVPSLTPPDLLSTSGSVDFSQSGPWKQDLFMGSGNLSSFDGKSFLVHGTATPSGVLRNGEALVYFNYFPKNQRRAFGTINLIKSSDQGKNWTQPSIVTIAGLPEFSIAPFSPKAIVMPNNRIKLYFLAKKKSEDRNKLFAALSDNGQNFVYDLTTSFEVEGESLIAFTSAVLNDRMHLLSYTTEGNQTGNAYHAISYDTKVFTRLADVKIQDSLYGQSALISKENKLNLVGTSVKGLWISTSNDGNSWGSPQYLSFKAQDPSLLDIGDKYLLFYTAEAGEK